MIRLELLGLPPSSNNAYINRRGGGIMLGPAGKKFKLETTTHFVRTYPRELMLFKKNTPYALVFRFYFENIENAGFVTGKAANRYKVFDGGNRMKLIEDALKDAGGIDDSQTLTSAWSKQKGTPERTLIWAWNLNEEACPLNDAIGHLT